MENWVGSLLIWGAVVYFVLMGLATFFQGRFVYYPDRRLHQDPGAVGLEFEDVWIRTPDDLKLHGWFVPAANAKGTILFFHGNAGNISHRLDSLEIFNELGFNTLIIDYRGYGKSEGKPTEIGTYIDAKAALDYLVEERKISLKKTILFGRSMGAAIAAWLGSTVDVPGIVLESGFTSAVEMGQRSFPIFPVRLLLRYKYETLNYVRRIRSPILIGHSTEDGLVPFKMGERLFQAASEPKEFLVFSGPHNCGFLEDVEPYKRQLGAFMRRVVGGEG